MYMYVDEQTGKRVEVLRSFADYSVIPSQEECIAAGMTAEEYMEAKWERHIGKVLVTKNPYFGSKGNW